MSTRHYSFIDRLLNQADQSLRTLVPGAAQAQRPSPAQHLANVPLDAEERRHIAGLMRINHTGEVCAQALYQGQALTAKLPEVREKMEHAAAEEIWHEAERALGGPCAFDARSSATAASIFAAVSAFASHSSARRWFAADIQVESSPPVYHVFFTSSHLNMPMPARRRNPFEILFFATTCGSSPSRIGGSKRPYSS